MNKNVTTESNRQKPQFVPNSVFYTECGECQHKHGVAYKTESGYRVLFSMNYNAEWHEWIAKEFIRRWNEYQSAQSRLKAMTSRIQEKDTEITNTIKSQKQEGREVPDWLKGQHHAYKRVLQIIQQHLEDE